MPKLSVAFHSILPTKNPVSSKLQSKFLSSDMGLYWGHIGIMEKKMETTIMGYIGVYGDGYLQLGLAGL